MEQLPAHIEQKLATVTHIVEEQLRERDLEFLFCADYIETEFFKAERHWLNAYTVALLIVDTVIFLNASQFAVTDEY